MFDKFNTLLLRLSIEFWRCKRGVTAVEYGVIAMAVVVGIVVLVFSVGDQIEGAFKSVDDEMKAQAGP